MFVQLLPFCQPKRSAVTLWFREVPVSEPQTIAVNCCARRWSSGSLQRLLSVLCHPKHLSPWSSPSHGPSPRRGDLADALSRPPALRDCCYHHSVCLVFLSTTLRVPLGCKERGSRLQMCPSPLFCKVAPAHPSFVSRTQLHISMPLRAG